MSPAQADFSRYRDPANGYESDYIPEQTYHHFPGKFTEDDPNSGYFSSATAPGRSQQHYAEDSDPKSRVFTGAGRSRTASSSAKRSRKTSSSTARELVRALINERLEADTTGEVQLARAYDIIKTESRRAADAERIALESTERLKGLAIARAREQKDAVRAQAELRAYKMQLDNAQKQLEEANAIVAASDAERMKAEHAVTRMKRTVEKFREGELARRAREQGFREGRREALWSIGADVPPVHSTHSRTRGPIYEDDDDDEVPHTPTSNVPLPVPPPESVPIMSRRAATPTIRRSTPIQQDWRTAPIPEVIRQEMTPPSRRASTPGWGLPVPPPASIPTLPRRGETPRPNSRRSGTPGPRQAPPPLEYDDFEPVPDPRAQHPEPDHIIIRSPVPVRPEPETPTGVPAQVYPTRPASSQATRPPPHAGHPQGHHPHDPRRHPRHHSMGDPAALATASADRIYSQYATSSESSSSEPRRPPSRGMRRHGLPQQEIIVPRPAQGLNHRFEPPIRPPSAADSVPASAAALARQRNRRPTSVSSSSTTSSARTETTGFPVPSRVARLQRQSLGERKWSAESGSSVPGITIEPPSRPESVDTVHTGMTRHSHLLPDGMPVMHADQTSSPGWGVQQPHQPHHAHSHSHSHSHHQPQMQPQRPPSRTGFMYGPPPSPGNNTTGGGPSHPSMSFGSPTSPGMSGPPIDFGAPPPPGMQPFPGMGMGGHMPPVTPVTSPEHERTGPGSAADYFAGDHHRGGSGGRQSLGRRQARHRREPAGMGMGAGMESVEELVHARGMGMGDLNAFHDPGTDPSLDEEEEVFGTRRERSITPRARTRTFSQTHSQGTGSSTGPYAFDERRAGFDERRRSGSIVGGSRSATPASGVGFVPPRPSSRASGSVSGAGVGMGMGPGGMGMYEDVGQGGPESGFDTPRRVPLPSSSASASRAASSKSGGRNNRRGRGGRGDTSILHGGISGRDAEGRSLERTPFGNTPFVRSSGLDED
ncbi:uncharacterized protein FOMMEDRAFT_148994 [Fomitiporia mediterranea MF3/22]|uniref:uncharacterized protein n=1 Tax=Fomitiporia mediterranea (strain MF3/22) TaxID=694068 RepID=UPI00044094DC|nr:uncharacterized protein FOMMEDRAFT_148994 [Fomitiporia mediterranea MF3/22]EJC98553.1 hypothetical protein FOMMEDRAFT_148994 [Fomitiporia mediterranea MF3/22]